MDYDYMEEYGVTRMPWPVRLNSLTMLPFEVIAAIDGIPVAAADEFGESIKTALDAKKKRVRLTIELLGKSRLADLELEEAAANSEAEEGAAEPAPEAAESEAETSP